MGDYLTVDRSEHGDYLHDSTVAMVVLSVSMLFGVDIAKKSQEYIIFHPSKLPFATCTCHPP